MTGTAPQTPPGTVLVVDDEAMLLMVVAETLRDAGFEVLEASDGQTALNTLRQNAAIRLLISDIKMPGMNGYQLVHEGLLLRPELKVVLMTGYAQDPAPATIRQNKIPVLYKPFNFDTLPGIAKDALGLAG